MRSEAFRALFGAPAGAAFLAPRVELVLRLFDGEPWTIAFSPGIERFIGHYPLLEGIAPEGTLLTYSRPHGR